MRTVASYITSFTTQVSLSGVLVGVATLAVLSTVVQVPSDIRTQVMVDVVITAPPTPVVPANAAYYLSGEPVYYINGEYVCLQ